MDRRVDRHRVAVSPGVPRRLRLALLVVPVLFLLVFYVWPVVTLVTEVAQWSDVTRTLTRRGVRKVVWFTTAQAVVSTVATVVIGLGPTYLLARWRFRGRRLLTAAVTVPFLLPTVVVGAAFTSLLPEPLERTTIAVIIAHVFFNVAVVVRVVGAVWAQLPDDLAGAARTLGATPWRATWHVTVPVLRPAISAAATIVFLFTFTSFGVVQILGGPRHPTIEVEIARRATQLGDVGGAAVLSMLQLIILVALVAVSARAQHRAVPLELRRGALQVARTTRQRLAVRCGALATAAFVVVPLAALALGSIRIGGRWTLTPWTTLGDPAVRPGVSIPVDPVGSIARSVLFAIAATLISVAVGALAALGIAAARRGGRSIDLGVMLPLGTSAVTIGFGMLITFDRSPVDWRGQVWLVPVGQALIAMPFVVRTLLPVLRSRPLGWIEAAATLGAAPVRAWWEIDVRRLTRPLVVAAGFAMAVSLGEFGATTFLSRTGTDTLPLAIARLLGRAGDLPHAQASALAVVLATLTLAILFAIEPAGDR
jgi:thiamine transport system permease protein